MSSTCFRQLSIDIASIVVVRVWRIRVRQSSLTNYQRAATKNRRWIRIENWLVKENWRSVCDSPDGRTSRRSAVVGVTRAEWWKSLLPQLPVASYSRTTRRKINAVLLSCDARRIVLGGKTRSRYVRDECPIHASAVTDVLAVSNCTRTSPCHEPFQISFYSFSSRVRNSSRDVLARRATLYCETTFESSVQFIVTVIIYYIASIYHLASRRYVWFVTVVCI